MQKNLDEFRRGLCGRVEVGKWARRPRGVGDEHSNAHQIQMRRVCHRPRRQLVQEGGRPVRVYRRPQFRKLPGLRELPLLPQGRWHQKIPDHGGQSEGGLPRVFVSGGTLHPRILLACCRAASAMQFSGENWDGNGLACPHRTGFRRRF